ncbi:hypothetical protein V8J88_02085 [Massilia sp. W12]|uniref:hypothetical protein n=1 Tax=Massilia sp. W12 TaxID=3126507 RepID=UPI0030D12986
MKFPVFICIGKSLIYVNKDFFEGIGHLDIEGSVLDMSVTKTGRSELNWILDSDGVFFKLNSEGLCERNFWQKMKLFRSKERLRISAGKKISVGEFLLLIDNLQDRFEEMMVVYDLKKNLALINMEYILDGEMIRKCLI